MQTIVKSVVCQKYLDQTTLPRLLRPTVQRAGTVTITVINCKKTTDNVAFPKQQKDRANELQLTLHLQRSNATKRR